MQRRVSDEELAADLRRIAQIAPRLTAEDIKEHGLYAYMTYRKYLGSLDAMRRAGGWVAPGEPAWVARLAAQAQRLDRWTEAQCVAFLRQHRWPAGVICPRCQEGGGVTTLKNQKIGNPEIRLFECRDCLYQFSDISGTVFHKSWTPIRTWFYALLAYHSPGATTAKARRMGISADTLFVRIQRLVGSAFAKSLALALIEALEGGKD